MKKEYRLQALLFCAVILLSALISQRLYLRADMTKQRSYTLSPYTKSVLDALDGTVSITWFRSYNIDGYLPALQYAADLLHEYQRYAGRRCLVVYKDAAELSPRQLEQLGIAARRIEKNGAGTQVLQNLYSGLLCEYRGESRVIPFLSDVYTLEADIARFITEMNQDAQNRRAERSVYVALPPDSAESRYKYVLPWLEYAGFIPIVLTAPFPELQPEIPLLVIGTSYFDAEMLTAVDVFVHKHGSAAFFVSAAAVDVAGSWQAVPKKEDGLLELLARSGFAVQHNLVMDPLNFRMTLPSADRTVYENINYPFWPQVFEQAGRGIAPADGTVLPDTVPLPPLIPAGKSVQFFWPSELVCTAARGKTPQPLLVSSSRSALLLPPYNTDPRGKQLAAAAASGHDSFPLAAVRAAGLPGGARVLVVADEYCLSTAIEFTGADSNMDFMVNAVHWLFRQDALLALKNKQPALLPFRFFESDAVFNRLILAVRIFNLAVVPLLIIATGTAAALLNRRKP